MRLKGFPLHKLQKPSILTLSLVVLVTLLHCPESSGISKLGKTRWRKSVVPKQIEGSDEGKDPAWEAKDGSKRGMYGRGRPKIVEVAPEEEDPSNLCISPMKVAKDGSQRGLKRRKKVKERLMDKIKAAVLADTGIVDWDPVVMMAVIAGRAFAGYPAVDDSGNPIIDEDTGRQLMVPPNPELAAAVGAKVAPFLYPHIRPKEVDPDDDRNVDPDDKKDQILSALENMGVEVVRDE